jgi:hypothetical protein
MLSILPICRFSLQPPIAEDVLKFDPTCLQEPSGPPTSFSDAKSRSSLTERILNKQQTGRQSIIIYILRAGPYALHFLRRLVLPKSVKQWSLRTLREKLIKIGAKVVSHSRYVIFQMVEVAVPQTLFREILDRIRQLRFLAIPARLG